MNAYEVKFEASGELIEGDSDIGFFYAPDYEASAIVVAETRGGARWAVCREYDVEFTDKMSIRLIEKNLPPEFKAGNLPYGVGYAEVDGKLVRMTDDEFEAFLETLPKEEEDHE